MAKVVTVLRTQVDFQHALNTQRDFGPEHVQAIQRQVRRWAPPGTEFLCLSDIPVPGVDVIPLQSDWPGWWAKLELFRPDLTGDILYTDLDNTIVGPIDDILAVNRLTAQIDFWTALLYLPESCRATVWKHFTKDPHKYMHYYERGNCRGIYGDAGYMGSLLEKHASHWETVPGEKQVVNIAKMMSHRWPKGHGWGKIAPHAIPKNMRILLSGQPFRPWTLPLFADKYWCQEDV